MKNCDNCKYYCWYYDKCSKWDCEVDAREIHNCFEPNDTIGIKSIINKQDKLYSQTAAGQFQSTDACIG